jgi:hypothetical protein
VQAEECWPTCLPGTLLLHYPAMKRLPLIGAVLIALVAPGVAQVAPLTDEQIDEAIALGKKGDVPIALVGRMLGISKGDFDVFIEGPMGRIAAAAEAATKQLRPFTRANVTAEMKDPVYRVLLQRSEHASGFAFAQHVVLMPKGSKNLEDAIQPVRESLRLLTGVYFDRLPDGEFDVVVATSKETQRYNVTSKARQKIR